MDAYEWHRATMAGEKPPIHETEPHAGWYVRRMVDRGPLVPAVIFWEGDRDDAGELLSDEVLRCEVCGVRRDPLEEWTYLASRPISETEYLVLMAELFTADVYRGPQRPRVRWLTQQEEAR